ncbi:polyprenyl synthetase family protein [Streptomyces sp. NPDC058486]|uniref:polyprenyl synthetase family protein n=1 Tax=unclassified Streptomyces TaxID=2593676 RepID=UPI003658D4A6
MTATTSTATAADGLTRTLDEVNRLVLASSGAGMPGVDAVLRYLPSHGGKGVRPRMALLASAAGGGGAADAPRPVGVAAGVELMHLGTLHHDDVVDESALRRGHPTVAALWGNRTAVFAGTFLLSRGTELIAAAGERAAGAAAACTAELWRGQTRELVATYRVDRTEEEYLDVIGRKTGALFGLAGLAGALAAHAPTATVSALERFGRTWGTAFQLADDLADLTSTTVRLGKPASADVRAGIYTLPVILALATDGPAGARLRTLLGVPGMDASGAAEVRELAVATGAVDRSVVALRGLLDRAHTELDAVPDTWARRQLHAMVEEVGDVV